MIPLIFILAVIMFVLSRRKEAMTATGALVLFILGCYCFERVCSLFR